MRRAFYAFIRRKPMRKGLCIPELNTGPLDLVPLNAGVCWPDAALCRWRPALSAAGSFAPPSHFSERKQAVWQRRASPQGECTCKLKVDTHKSVGVYFFRGKMKKRR